MMSKRDAQLLIVHSSVRRTSLAGAHERGVAASNEAPSGWDHSGLVFGNEDRPIAAVRPSRDGLRFFDLTRLGRTPLPDSRLGKGVAVTHGLDRELPRLLGKTLAVGVLTGANTAAALRAGAAPRVLRFIMTDRVGRSMGYSVVVAP